MWLLSSFFISPPIGRRAPSRQPTLLHWSHEGLRQSTEHAQQFENHAMRNRALFVFVVTVLLAVAVEGQGWMTPSPYSPPSPRPSLSPSHFGSVGGGGWGVPDPQWEGGGRFGR